MFPRLLLDPLPGEMGGGSAGGATGAGGVSSTSAPVGPTYAPPPSGTPSSADAPGGSGTSFVSATPSVASTPPGVMGAPGGSGGMPAGTGGAGSPAPPPSAGVSLRASLVQAGYQVPDSMSDEQVVGALVQMSQQAEQSRYYAQLGQSMYPHYGRFREWMDAQGQTGSAAGTGGASGTAQPAGPWTPPHFDPQWMSVVEQDPNTGQYRSKPGYDPAYGTQVQQYNDYVREGQRMALADPPKWIERYGAPMVQKMVSEAIQTHFGTYRNEVQAQQIVAQNAQWLYHRDPTGRVVMDPTTGSPQLSPQGVRFARYVAHAAQTLKIQDLSAQQEYAMNMLELEMARSGRAAQPPAAPAAPQVPAGGSHAGQWNQLQAQALLQPGRADVQPTAQPSGTPGSLSLTEMMRQGMRQAGVTDEQLRAEAMSGVYE